MADTGNHIFCILHNTVLFTGQKSNLYIDGTEAHHAETDEIYQRGLHVRDRVVYRVYTWKFLMLYMLVCGAI